MTESSTSGKEAVTFELVDGVAILTLNEPDSRNALSGPLKAALASHVFEAMASQDVGCLLLTGTGKAFCAGGDLRSMSERAPLAVRERMRGAHGWVRQLTHGDKPVVAAVNGAAAGAGLSLVLLCDVVVASERATFMSGFSGIGTVPDLGLAHTLPRAVGVPLAKDLLLTGRKLDASEALRSGLVSRVVAPEALREEALDIARGIAHGPVSLRLTKQLINQGMECGAEAFLGHEALAQATAFSSADFAEGVSAFLAKRTPNFSGR